MHKFCKNYNSRGNLLLIFTKTTYPAKNVEFYNNLPTALSPEIRLLTERLCNKSAKLVIFKGLYGCFVQKIMNFDPKNS